MLGFHFRADTRWFRFGVWASALLLLSGALYTGCSFFGCSEGRVTAYVHFDDGTPAPCVQVDFEPVALRGAFATGNVRLPMEIPSTDSKGYWNDVNSWPYGQYALTVFTDRTQTVPLERRIFTVWPVIRNHVVIAIPNAAKPIPFSAFPNGCLGVLDLRIP